jgi:hypothetical protein
MNQKLTFILLTALLLAPLAASQGAPLDGAIFLGVEQANMSKPGAESAPVKAKPVPVLDGDGFPVDQVVQSLAPEAGALSWAVEVPKGGRYLATLEFSHVRHGNAFELRCGPQKLAGFVPDTRGGLALIEMGTLDLAAGSQTLTLLNTTTVEKTWMAVGSIYLRPIDQQTMTKPQIRAAIAKLKPRKLPTELLMPVVFSDRMVLQRDLPVPVWGRAVPGTDVSVKFAGQMKQVRTDVEGYWAVKLDPLKAGGPFELEVGDGTKILHFTDVLVGEVWFGSGQSNMEVAVKFLPQFTKSSAPFECDEDTKQLLENGVHPQIRISAITRDRNKTPAWFELSQGNCLDVPALMSCTAVLLRQKLNVPIGIIVRCESSSSSGIWLSRDTVEGEAEIQRQIREYAEKLYPQLVSDYPDKLKAWEVAVIQAQAQGRGLPAKPATPALPGGFPASFFSEGRFEHYGANYPLRIASLAPFAVRGIVWDQGEGGTGIAGADQTAVMPALVRSWRAAWGKSALPFIYVNKKNFTGAHRDALAMLPHTARAEHDGLSTINHPPDKAAYARRIVEQMEQLVYQPATR